MNRKNKKIVIVSAAILVMVLATAAYALHGFRDHMRHGRGKEFIRAKMAEGLETAAKQHQNVRKTVREEMALPDPDVKKLAVTMKDRIRTMPDVVTMQIDYLLEVYEILTPDQQTQLVQMLKQRMERHGSYGIWRDERS